MVQPAAQRLVSESRLGTLAFTSVKAQPYGATGDGTTDDTAAFTAAIASGVKTFFVPDGIYILNKLTMNVAGQTMLLSAGATLRAKGAGATSPGAIAEITAANSGIVGIGFGATIDGNGQGTSAGTAVLAYSGGDQIVQGLTFVNLTGSGVTIGAGGDRALVDNNTIINPVSAGVFLASAPGSNLTSPTVSNNRISIASGTAYGIQFHVNPVGVIYRPRCLNNDVNLPALATSGIGIEMFGGNSFGSVVGNTVEGGSIGISVDSGPSITVTGNSVHGSNFYGIEFASSSYSTCSGNTIDGNGVTSKGVSISNTAGGHNTVAGNTISNLGATAVGIHAQDVAGTSSVISGNNVTGFNGIIVGNQSGHSITGNVVTCVGTGALIGITLDNVTNSVVSGNTIINATTSAVQAFTGTMNGLVIGPNILAGTTTTDLSPGWTPGTNGVGSQLIRGNYATVGTSTPTVGASPYTYTNTTRYQQVVYVRGGTVSSIARNATTVATASNATVVADPGETVVITYTAAPTVVVDTK